MSKRTLVLGASPNPARYAYLAVQRLRAKDYEVIALGRREGQIGDVRIHTELLPFENIHTVTLYVGSKHQPTYYDYVINTLNPKRIIFNPGTENNALQQMAKAKKIETVTGCTLVMLSLGSF